MIRFATLNSEVELSFWASLASDKINKDKLDESARPLVGAYEIRPQDEPDLSCRIQIHGDALTNETLVYKASILNCPRS